MDWFGDRSVAVLDLALACCALETDAARPVAAPTMTELGPDTTLVVTVSGTLTNALAPVVANTIARQPVPPVVVAFGACACIGGPYWDAYSVTKGVDQLVAVDYVVPGCPPPPEALTAVLEQVRHGV